MSDKGKKKSKRHGKASDGSHQKNGIANESTSKTTNNIEDKAIAQDMGENKYTKTTQEKKANLEKPTVQPIENISPVYKDMESSCKPLYTLVESIYNASKCNVLANKKVIDNFKDAKEIFEGLTQKQNTPKASPKSTKGKPSNPSHSVDDSTTKYQELESKIEQYQQYQKRLETDRETMTKELALTKQFLAEKESQYEKQVQDSDGRIQLIEKLKQELESETKNHEKTKAEKANVQALSKRLETDKQILESQLGSAERSLDEKKEELETLGKYLIERSDYIEKIKRENETLANNLTHTSSERNQKIEEINELRNRLSCLSASRLDGDPNITDLGDPNRPLKLVERYQQLYDNLWTDAFGELTDSYTEIKDSNEKEKKAASEIITVFQDVIQFCQDVMEDQERTILSTLLCCTRDELDGNKVHINISTIRTIRKSIVQHTIRCLHQEFMKKQRNLEINVCMSGFIEECLAICWMSLVQDPPMAFELDYCHGSVVDKEVMREFTVSGDQVDFVVWPALRLTKSGPIMVKSVIQPIKKESMKG